MVGSASIPWRSIGSIAIRTGCHSNIFHDDIQDTGGGAAPNRDCYATVLLAGDANISV